MYTERIRLYLKQIHESGAAEGAPITKDEITTMWHAALHTGGDTGLLTPADAKLFLDLLEQGRLPEDAVIFLRRIVSECIPSLLYREQAGTPPAADVAGVLTGFNAQEIKILSSGALHCGPVSGTDPLAAAALLVLGQLKDGTNPFKDIRDAELLQRIFRMHYTLYTQAFAGTNPGNAKAYEKHHARAALLAIMRLTAEQVTLLEGCQTAVPLVQPLLARCLQEPYLALRQFEIHKLLASAALGMLPEIQAVESVVFPAAPPYAEWKQDGVLRIKVYYDDNDRGSSTREDLAALVTGRYSYIDRPKGVPGPQSAPPPSLGMIHKEGNAGNPGDYLVFTRNIDGMGGGFRSMELILTPRPGPDRQPVLFESMDDPGIDIILYSGHANYGQRVEAALRQGVTGTGKGKLVMLMQCNGYMSLDSVHRAFPEVQFFSTTDVTTKAADYDAMERVFNAFAHGLSWNDIIKQLPAESITGYNGWKKLFFTPAVRPVTGKRLDFDRDGMPDFNDAVFTEPQNMVFNPPSEFNTVCHDLPVYTLNASRFQQAIADASLILLYNNMGLTVIPPGAANPLDLKQPGLLVNGGFFTPQTGENNAFRFAFIQVDAKPGISVQLHAGFAHASARNLKSFLAYELGKQLAEWSGKSGAEIIACGMAHYLQNLFQHKPEWEQPTVLGNETIEYRLFLARYNLPGWEFRDFFTSLGEGTPVFNTDNAAVFIGKTTGAVRDANAGGRLFDGMPRPVGRTLAIGADGIPVSVIDGLGRQDLAAEQIEKFIRTLDGYSAARVLYYSPDQYRASVPYLVVVQKPGGEYSSIVLAVDGKTGSPVAAEDWGTIIDMRNIAVADTLVKAAAVKRSLWPGIWPPYKGDVNGEELAKQLYRQLKRDFDAGLSFVDVAMHAAAFLEQHKSSKAQLKFLFNRTSPLLSVLPEYQALTDYLYIV